MFCFLAFYRLHYNQTSRKMGNTPGVITRTPDFGNTSAIEWLDPTFHAVGIYFFPFIEKLCGMGYQRGKTIRAAPYDFRYDAGIYYHFLYFLYIFGYFNSKESKWTETVKKTESSSSRKCFRCIYIIRILKPLAIPNER